MTNDTNKALDYVREALEVAYEYALRASIEDNECAQISHDKDLAKIEKARDILDTLQAQPTENRYSNEYKTGKDYTDSAEAVRGNVAQESMSINKEKLMFTYEQIEYMRDRFLGWKLPKDFSLDGGISFAKKPHNIVNEPFGTNVFDAQQAEQSTEK